MSKRSLVFFTLVVTTLVVAAGIPIISEDSDQEIGLISGQNVNMVSNEDPLEGDPYLQRQNEPSIAASSRNPLHLLAGANDYRTIDIPFDWEVPGFIFEETSTPPNPDPDKDAWLGVFKSIDGGLTWTSTLLPGFPQDASPEGIASPLQVNGYTAAADPVVRTGTNGLFFYSGIAFTRLAANQSTNGAEQPSAVFVARFIDNNNQEDTETIEYLDTQIIDSSDNPNYSGSDIFIDKPWIATDLPHGVGQKVTINGQQIPRSNVYVVYSLFSGPEADMESHIMFWRSTDCGESWEPPIELSTGHYLNQGATIAVDPRGNGQLCVSWRRFEKSTQKNAIVVAISTNGGVDFDRDIVVSEFLEPPFDQPTIPIPFQWPLFRTNTYPTSTMDGDGNIYIAWTKRGFGPNGEAQIMISTSHDGLTWSVPKEAITSFDDWTNPFFPDAPGHQFMPSITFAAGKLILIWYDQRWDLSAWLPPELVIFYDRWIWEAYDIRHTIDVRAAQAKPSLDPDFSKSIQVSRYRWAEIGPLPVQLEFNRPNLPLFQTGKAPFIGDYIDITPSPSIIPVGNHWRFNIDPNSSTVYHAAWTDNRDVKPSIDDLWGDNYQAPGTDCTTPEYAGIRNQNIYTSRISEGITASSPGNTKPLNILRAFVIQVNNTTEFEKIVTLEKDPNSPPTANFWQAGENMSSLTATIPPYSSISTTVLVEPYPDENASVIINVYDESTNILLSQVTLNPDSTNPAILDPGNWEDPVLSIISSEIHTPHSRNYDPENPPILTPHSRNYDLANDLLMNTDLLTPHSRNYDLENSPVLNPHSRNSALEANEGPTIGAEVTDLIWNVENSGNTTSSYSLTTFPISFPAPDDDDVLVQILVYKIYLTPMTMNCSLLEEENHELVVSITNPHSRNDPLAIDGSFYLAPGQQANIIYRVYAPPGSNFDPTSLNPELTQDVPNFIDDELQSSVGSMVFITTTSLLDGVINQQYPSTPLEATGDTENYIWTLAEDSEPLPYNMELDSNGVIRGTPQEQTGIEYPAIYSFTVQFSDLNDPYISASQNLSIRIAKPLVIDDINFSPEWIVEEEYPEATLQATGGIPPYTWNLASGPETLPYDMRIEEDGTITGTPDPDSAGKYIFKVDVTDSGNPQQSVESDNITIIIYDKLEIITTIIPSDWYLGSPYSATIEASGGKTSYTWELDGQLPPGLDWTEVGENSEKKVVISGTPEYDPGAVYPAIYNFDVTVTDAFIDAQYHPDPQTKMKPFSITIHLKDTSAYAQYEGLGDNKASAIDVDSAGNVYVTGYSRGKTTGPDFYTVKYDRDLNEIWAEPYDGPSHLGDFATDIVVKDHNGNTYVYVTGYSYRGKREKHADYCTLKYDSDGNLLWDKRYDSRRNGQDFPNALAVDDEGNVYVTGKSEESLEDEPLRSFDYLTIKYSNRGRMRWDKRYEGIGVGTDDEATAIVVKPNLLGDVFVYVTGYSELSNHELNLTKDFATIKYDATNGNEVWTTLDDGVANYDGGHDDVATDMVVKADQLGKTYVYVTGYSELSNHELNLTKDFATIKYDATNGDEVWTALDDGVATYDGGDDDVANALAVDDDGNVYVTGNSFNADGNSDFTTIKYKLNGDTAWSTPERPDGEIRYDGGLGDDEAVAIFVDDSGIYVTGTSQGANKDYFTLKYNTTGSVIWMARYDSIAHWNDFVTAMVVDSEGNVYVIGYSQNPDNIENNYILTVKY